MSIEKRFFGKLDGKGDVDIYKITNKNGAFVELMTLGAGIHSINVPDRNGKLGDVVLGFDDVNNYLNPDLGYQGLVVGRYANRIRDAKFSMDGVEYNTPKNQGTWTLHGGGRFSFNIWEVKETGNDFVVFSFFSPDMQDGFPGNFTMNVKYTFDDSNTLKIEYFVLSDKKTVANPTNHAYFNLSADSSKTVEDEYAYLFIDCLPPRKFSVYPKNLDDFAIGYCLGEGLIKTNEDIEEIKVSKTNVLVKTRLNHTSEEDFEQDDIVQKRKGECEHACVCRLLEYQGVNSDNAGGIRSQLKTVTPNNSPLKIDATQIIKDMENLKENAKIWQETGSVHVAQLIYKNKSIIREDVSRHVAVDKVIGAAFKSGYDLTQSYITYSGRMPADMLIKVIRVGIPIIISNAAPAASGYEIAKKGNITMVGFVRNNRFNLYSAPQRINLEK